MSLSAGGRSDQVQARRGTPGFLTTHGFKMLMGRDFIPEEGTVGKNEVVVLTNTFWRTRFGADPAILNQQIRVDGKPHTVVGVLAPGVADRLESQLFFPLAFRPEQANHDFHWLLVLGRLKPDVTLAQANADMASVTKQMAELYPRSKRDERKRRASEEQLPRREPDLDALAAARRRWFRAAHRLYQCREPAAR